MLAVVTELPLGEPARFNPGQLESLCNRVGEIEAETEVARALDRIAATIAILGAEPTEEDRADFRWLLVELQQDAELIGMATLARVAQDVLDCEAEGDPIAFHATFARLRRVGDRSICALWDLDDLSG